MRSAFPLSLVAILACVCLAPALAADPDIDTIIKKMDELYRSASSHATMEMRVVTSHWERTLTGRTRPRRHGGAGRERCDGGTAGTVGGQARGWEPVNYNTSACDSG